MEVSARLFQAHEDIAGEEGIGRPAFVGRAVERPREFHPGEHHAIGDLEEGVLGRVPFVDAASLDEVAPEAFAEVRGACHKGMFVDLPRGGILVFLRGGIHLFDPAVAFGFLFRCEGFGIGFAEFGAQTGAFLLHDKGIVGLLSLHLHAPRDAIEEAVHARRIAVCLGLGLALRAIVFKREKIIDAVRLEREGKEWFLRASRLILRTHLPRSDGVEGQFVVGRFENDATIADTMPFQIEAVAPVPGEIARREMDDLRDGPVGHLYLARGGHVPQRSGLARIKRLVHRCIAGLFRAAEAQTMTGEVGPG